MPAKPTPAQVKARGDGLFDAKSDDFVTLLIEEVATQYAAVKSTVDFQNLVILHVLCLLWAEKEATKNGGKGDVQKTRAGEVEAWYGGQQKVFSGLTLYMAPWGDQLKRLRLRSRILGSPAVGGGPSLM